MLPLRETIHMVTSKNSGSGAPLRPVVFAVFLALNEHALHGYAIMKAVNDRLRHRAIVGPGTLYRTLKELRDHRISCDFLGIVFPTNMIRSAFSI